MRLELEKCLELFYIKNLKQTITRIFCIAPLLLHSFKRERFNAYLYCKNLAFSFFLVCVECTLCDVKHRKPLRKA